MADPINLALILKAGDLALKVPALLGLVETLDKKIDRLAEADLEAGYDFIRHAQTARSRQIRHDLLNEGFKRFILAKNKESQSLRLASAYFGGAFCAFEIKEDKIAFSLLDEILDIKPQTSVKDAAIGGVYLLARIQLIQMEIMLTGIRPILKIFGKDYVAADYHQVMLRVYREYRGLSEAERLARFQDDVHKFLYED